MNTARPAPPIRPGVLARALRAARPHALIRRVFRRVFGAAHRHWCVALGVLSFLVTLPVPLLSRSQFADLTNHYTDHLHHSFATWAFLHRGLDLYRLPFGIAVSGIHFAHAYVSWPQMPMAYPPGVFLVFLPLAILGEYVPMSQRAFAATAIVYMLVMAHAAIVACWAALAAARPGARLIVGVLAWMVLIRLGLNGFFDVIWIGCGAMMVRSITRGRYAVALRWFTVAVLLHFRAAVLAPLAVAALTLGIRGKPSIAWPRAEIVAAYAACAISVAAFLLMYPATHAYRDAAMPLSHFVHTRVFWTVIVLGALAASSVFALSETIAAATIVLGSICAIIDLIGYLGFWHHASLALIAPLSVGAISGSTSLSESSHLRRLRLRPPPDASVARQIAVLWILTLEALVWSGSGGAPTGLFQDFCRYYRSAF